MTAGREAAPAAVRHQRIALVDLLDRVLAGGVVVVGDVTLSIADVDLVTISLRALLSSATGADLGSAPVIPGAGPAGAIAGLPAASPRAGRDSER